MMNVSRKRFLGGITAAAAMGGGGCVSALAEKGARTAVPADDWKPAARWRGVIDMQRNAGRFVMERPRLGASIATLESRLRAPYRKMFGRDTEKMELQVLSIGDVAFVGVKASKWQRSAEK